MTTPPWGEEPSRHADALETQPYGQPSSYDPYHAVAANPYAVPGQAFQPQRTNGVAIASLVVSIITLVSCCGLGGFIGAIFGHIARKQIREDSSQTGDGMALAGMIVGYVGTAFSIAVFAVVFAASI